MTALAPAVLPGPGPDRGPGLSPAWRLWHTWRVPMVLIAIVVAGGTLIALLQPAPANTYLDPTSTAPTGTHALADILAARGHPVVTTTTPAQASSAARARPSTVVITSPQYLSARQIAVLARLPGNLVVVAPDQPALTELVPGAMVVAGLAVGQVRPRCQLAAAQLAGNADMGGSGLELRGLVAGAQLCYSVAGLPTLAEYVVGGKTIAILGNGQLLSNQSLGQLGNAALALNLLETSQRVVWLVPAPGVQVPAALVRSPRSFTSFIPLGAWLVVLQLAIAALLAALWRARRLGPILAEPLPVVVRAAETVEGHARLYLSRRASGRAAEGLRAATIDRLAPVVGVPRPVSREAMTAAAAARSGLPASRIEAVLFGPPPANDAALVKLADEIDALERQVRAQ